MPAQLPPDDQSITDDEVVFIRVYYEADSIVRVEGTTTFRPNSGELRSAEPLSVDLGSACSPQETQNRDASGPFHVAAIPVSSVRAAGAKIVRDPQPGNPAHALIYGAKDDGSLTKGQAKAIAKSSTIVVLNADAPLPEDDLD